jgi:hypothetical protein
MLIQQQNQLGLLCVLCLDYFNFQAFFFTKPLCAILRYSLLAARKKKLLFVISRYLNFVALSWHTYNLQN